MQTYSVGPPPMAHDVFGQPPGGSSDKVVQRRVPEAASSSNPSGYSYPGYPSYTAPSPYAGSSLSTTGTYTTATSSSGYGVTPGYSTNASGTPYTYGGGYSMPPPPPPPPAAASSTVVSGGSAMSGGKATERLSYPHNTAVACFLLPTLWSVLQRFESTAPVTAFLFLGLFLYCLDLANLREGFVFILWMSVLGLTMNSAWFLLIEVEGEEAGPIVLFFLIQILHFALLFVCGACWLTLQVEWLTNSAHIERTLHAVLPLVVSSLGTMRIGAMVEADFGRDVAGILAPYIFAVLLTASMLTLGSAATRGQSATFGGRYINASDPQGKATAHSFILSRQIAFGHSAVLLLVPVSMHLNASMGRILSAHSSMDDVYDLLLVAAVPYLLQYVITCLHEAELRPSPYATPKLGNTTYLSGALRPMMVGIAASLALQQRYLIALSHSFSYHFVGEKTPAWLISIYWTAGTMAMIFTFSIWGRKSRLTNELLFGEYHEDVVQLSLSVTGLFVGKGVGLPWNFTPLPVLAFLGLSLWLTTRMLRYLAIFLFVLHATGVVVFTYRFAGIDDTMDLPFPGLKLSLTHFGLSVVFASILIGLVAGIAVRSTGGYGSSLIKRFDLGGLVFVFYVLSLSALEITLMKRSVPANELVGVVADEVEADDVLYDPAMALLTSVIIVGISTFMLNVKIISGKSFAVLLSLSIGKAISIYVDATDEMQRNSGSIVYLRTVLAAFLCLIMISPRYFLKPVHVKTPARHRRSLSSGRSSELPPGAARMSFMYVFFFLPLAIAVAAPYLLYPLANAIRLDFQGDSYYSVSPPVSEVMGTAISLWGLSSIFMLNYYLPDGGAEFSKQLSALAFLMGIAIFFAAPTLGITVDATSNPYAAISVVGGQIVSQGKTRTGGWGLLVAGFATLLALAGPLELSERRSDSAKRDKYLLFRTMIFSILFGGGLAWFVVMQSMSEADWLVLLLTGLACLSISFLGTVSSVLGYFIELEDFEEVEQIFSIWLGALPVFLPVTGLPQFLQVESSHPFGVGGWLSTYLVIGSGAALAFAAALRQRPTKNAMTRGLGNLSVMISWTFAICVLYGRYGVTGLDVNFDVTTVFGMPASVFGTLVVSLILLLLEGESSKDGRTRTKRVTSNQKKTSSLGINFSELTASNSWVPLVAGTALVFVAASFYAIAIRGSGVISMLSSYFGVIAKTHEEVFSNVFGDSKDDQDLSTLAQKTISHSRALAASAKLASAGIWTASDPKGPQIHMAGLAAVLPSLYLLISRGWSGAKGSSIPVALAAPLNTIPLVFCHGIPSLQSAAVLGLCGGLLQWIMMRRRAHQSNMRI